MSLPKRLEPLSVVLAGVVLVSSAAPGETCRSTTAVESRPEASITV